MNVAKSHGVFFPVFFIPPETENYDRVVLCPSQNILHYTNDHPNQINQCHRKKSWLGIFKIPSGMKTFTIESKK